MFHVKHSSKGLLASQAIRTRQFNLRGSRHAVQHHGTMTGINRKLELIMPIKHIA